MNALIIKHVIVQDINGNHCSQKKTNINMIKFWFYKVYETSAFSKLSLKK